jgi:hypothetical protein
MLILMTLPLNTAIDRFKASAVVAGAAQLHACACSVNMKQNTNAHINIRNWAGLIAHRALSKKCESFTPRKSYAFVAPLARRLTNTRSHVPPRLPSLAVASDDIVSFFD